VTGLAQELPRETVGAAYGDALLAAIAAGLADERTSWTAIVATVHARPELRARYDRMYDVYRSLYERTAELAHELADVQRDAAEDMEPAVG
jgi:xylulokinase